MKKIFLACVLALTMMGCGSSKDDSIIVYTNSGSNGRDVFLKELAKENGFDINVVSGGGTDIANRLIAEKNNPIADVIFGLNNIEYEKLKKENILKKFNPSWAGEIPEGLSDKEGYYNAITATPLLAIYNPNIIKGEDIPKDWTDLATNPKFKDKYYLFSAIGGTGKVILSSVISRYRDDNGVLNVSSEGWKMVENLYSNGYVERGEEDWFGNLMSGKRPITMIWGSGALEREKANNFKVGVMRPEIGVPFVVEHVALVNKKNNTENVEKFADWLGSPEVQEKWAHAFGTAPAHPKALEKAPQEVKDLVESVKIQDLDWKFISENVDSWIEKVELEYRK